MALGMLVGLTLTGSIGRLPVGALGPGMAMIG
jgi:hypothetical protein